MDRLITLSIKNNFGQKFLKITVSSFQRYSGPAQPAHKYGGDFKTDLFYFNGTLKIMQGPKLVRTFVCEQKYY